MPGAVGVEVLRLRPAYCEQLGADEVGDRVEVVVHEMRTGAGDVVGEARHSSAEHPHRPVGRLFENEFNRESPGSSV